MYLVGHNDISFSSVALWYHFFSCSELPNTWHKNAPIWA